MLNKLKNWILRKEIASMKLSQDMADERKKIYVSAMEGDKLSRLLREELKGFDVKILDSDLDVEDWYTEQDSRRTFLEQCHELFKSSALKDIAKFLIRNQMQYTTTEAKTLEDMNFGRATINGIVLLQEEVDRLNTLYLTEVKPPDKFDEHDIT
jgi:hypothetical protein